MIMLRIRCQRDDASGRVTACAVISPPTGAPGQHYLDDSLCLPRSQLRRLVGTYRAERMMVAGQMLEPEQAQAIGLVDELTDMDEVLPRALAWLRDLLKLPPQAMSTTRLLARSDLIGLFADPTRLSVEEFADGWFGAETQATLRALVAKLKKG